MTYSTLIVQCGILFMASLSAGGIPMMLSLSHRKMRFVTILGIGILLGTAFALIIPQGVELIYSMDTRITNRIVDIRTNPTIHHMEWSIQDWSNAFESDTLIDDHDHDQHVTLNQTTMSDEHNQTQSQVHAKLYSIQGSLESSTRHRFGLQSTDPIQSTEHIHDDENVDHDEMHNESEGCNSEPEGSSSIGSALVLGFAIMLIVDRLTLHMLDKDHPSSHMIDDFDMPSAGSASPGRDHDDTDVEMDVVQRSNNLHHINPATISPALLSTAPPMGARQLSNSNTTASNQTIDRERVRVQREKERERLHGYQSYDLSHTHSNITNVSPSALVALLVNSLVDGISLGAIAFTSDWAMTFAMFTSVLFQKAPVAFGFVCYLMYQNTSAAQIKICLIFYALAAPFSAAVTYLILGSQMEQLTLFEQLLQPSVHGLLVLFSAGTFLFTVAVHVMPAIHNHASPNDCSHEKRLELEVDRSAPHEVESLITGSHGHSHGPATSQQRLRSPHQTASPAALTDEEPLEWRYVITLIAGIITPLFLSLIVDRPLVR